MFWFTHMKPAAIPPSGNATCRPFESVSCLAYLAPNFDSQSDPSVSFARGATSIAYDPHSSADPPAGERSKTSGPLPESRAGVSDVRKSTFSKFLYVTLISGNSLLKAAMYCSATGVSGVQPHHVSLPELAGAAEASPLPAFVAHPVSTSDTTTIPVSAVSLIFVILLLITSLGWGRIADA